MKCRASISSLPSGEKQRVRMLRSFLGPICGIKQNEGEQADSGGINGRYVPSRQDG
jgi:hypothetical protein